MPKQLVEFPLFWSLALLLAPVPALCNIDSNCTVGDSPGKCAVAVCVSYDARCCIIVRSWRDMFKVWSTNKLAKLL